MRNSATMCGVIPREARYSRAWAASGRRNCSWKKVQARSWMSIRPPRSLATRSSSGEEKLILGMGIFSFSAIRRTASGKVMFSIFCTKVKTSPDAPQPKQWKNCREACTDMDGDFS